MTNASPQGSSSPPHVRDSSAALTETVRQVDVIHTSLAGMTAIVLLLLFAVALPVFGKNPVTQPIAFGVMVVVSFIGIVGLYVLNYRVHKHVTDQARLTEVLVNSLGQGFLFFGRDGICGEVYSQACLDLLESIPVGKPITEVLGVPQDQRADFMEWIDVLYQPDHALGFDDVVRFLPQYYTHNADRRIALVYKPILGESRELTRVVLIATDQTEEYVARQLAKRQEDFAEMICRIFKDRNQFQATLAHIREFLDDAKNPATTCEDASRLLRQVHTLKAAVKQFNLVDLSKVMTEAENDLRAPTIVDDPSFLSALAQSSQKISDALARLVDEVSNLIGTEYEWRGNIREIGEADLYSFARELKENNVAPDLLLHFVESIAAVPLRDCFYSFERELRELSGMVEKQIKPVCFAGLNPRVLTQPMQEFLFSLTHICRNIVDHGIEPPVTRMARGKDPAGLVTVSFDVLPDEDKGEKWLRILIADDGNGIDPARVRAKLYSLDPEGAWRFEDDQAVIQRIFTWNFTTTEAVTALSGRGIGMEAVEMEVKKLGGSIQVSSQLYKGATFDIKIPYRLDLI